MLPGQCRLETIAPNGELGPLIYQIGRGGVVLQPEWSSNQASYNCPSEYSIAYKDPDSGALISPLPSPQIDVVRFNTFSGSILIETDDYSFDGVTWII